MWISIPAPARGRTIFSVCGIWITVFQFPPPRGGEPDTKYKYVRKTIFQFPPPRGGEPLLPRLEAPAGDISIPAPARGRTRRFRISPGILADFNSRPREGANPGSGGVWRGDERISIPAPARGRTIALLRSWMFAGFQFPPPRGGEPKRHGLTHSGGSISIPAPARGRTRRLLRAKTKAVFQFPPPRGGEP